MKNDLKNEKRYITILAIKYLYYQNKGAMKRQFGYGQQEKEEVPVLQVRAGYLSGLAGGLSISTTDKAWQIMVEVPDIFY